jgi:hypothetical protein
MVWKIRPGLGEVEGEGAFARAGDLRLLGCFNVAVVPMGFLLEVISVRRAVRQQPGSADEQLNAMRKPNALPILRAVQFSDGSPEGGVAHPVSICFYGQALTTDFGCRRGAVNQNESYLNFR